jgi:LPS sulfotransferase NodH
MVSGPCIILSMPPIHCYIVAATYRSGSTLLCESLAATDLAGDPKEYFHRLNETSLAREDYLEFVRQTIRDTAAPNGVFGAKFLWHHVAYLCDKVRAYPEFHGRGMSSYETLATLFANPHYIRITRRDKLGQAISMAKARQTGVFHQFEGKERTPQREPVFDAGAIEYYLRKSRLDDLAWQVYFDKFEIAPFEVEYETFLTRREEITREILDFLGIPVPAGFRLGEASIKRTSDDVNKEWRRRFLELQERTKHSQ